MKTFSIYETKAKLSSIIDSVMAGEACTISRHGEPVAVIMSYEQAKKKRVFGSFKGRVKFLKGWDSPMTEEDLTDWGV